MTRTAIIAAMAGELKPLVRGWLHERRNGVDLWRSGFPDNEKNKRQWVAACAGAGVEAVTRALAEIEKDGRVDRVVSTGWAGALSDEFAPGVAYRVSGVIDARTGESFPVTDWRQECWLVTSPRVAGQAEKRRLAAAYGAGLVDMEAAGVARLAEMRAIPFYCVKGISDGYRDKLPDFNRFISQDGHFHTLRFMLFALLRPWHWPALMRMGENSSKAAHCIRECVLEILRNEDQ
jgi:adenosylhomocysteine nucleosidase